MGTRGHDDRGLGLHLEVIEPGWHLGEKVLTREDWAMLRELLGIVLECLLVRQGSHHQGEKGHQLFPVNKFSSRLNGCVGILLLCQPGGSNAELVNHLIKDGEIVVSPNVRYPLWSLESQQDQMNEGLTIKVLLESMIPKLQVELVEHGHRESHIEHWVFGDRDILHVERDFSSREIDPLYC